MKNPAILIVDDDEDDRLIIQESFEKNGQNSIAFFEDSLSILAYLSNHREKENLPKLIISDLNMPGMTGMDLLRTIKQVPEFKSIDVVIFSTTDKAEYVQECLKWGAKAYFRKPDDYADLNLLTNKFSQMAAVKAE